MPNLSIPRPTPPARVNQKAGLFCFVLMPPVLSIFPDRTPHTAGHVDGKHDQCGLAITKRANPRESPRVSAVYLLHPPGGATIDGRSTPPANLVILEVLGTQYHLPRRWKCLGGTGERSSN